MKKSSTIFLLVLFISQMNGQKIDSLTIDKSCLTKSFIVPTALLTGGIFLLNSVQIIPFRKNLIPFFGNGWY
jgi:hypothetical protein